MALKRQGFFVDARQKLLFFCLPFLFCCRLLADQTNAVCVSESSFKEWGPLYSSSEDYFLGWRGWQAMGPFMFGGDDQRQTQWGVRPLFSSARHLDIDGREFDILYPLAGMNRFGQESRHHLFQLISWTHGLHAGENPERKITLFPFVFYKNSTADERDYFAFFPLGGTVQNRFTFDRAAFVLFPCYAWWIRDDVNYTFLPFPFYGWIDGPEGHRGRRYFPFYGWESKPGHFDKKYFLFPIFLLQDLDLQTDAPRKLRAVFPLWIRQASSQLEDWMILWPFFRYLDNNSINYREINAPWPFIVFGEGPDRVIDRIWPLYGWGKTPTRTGLYYLWPLYKRNTAAGADYSYSRTRILFYLYSDRRQKVRHETGEHRRIDVWPLFTWSKSPGGTVSFHTLSLLEPILTNNKSIERNWSPLWQLFEFQKESNGSKQISLLWNLYRSKRDVESMSSHNSFLAGLVQHDQMEKNHCLKLFHLFKFRWRKNS